MSLRLKLLAAFAYVLVLVLIALEIPLVLSLSSRVDSEVRSQATAQAQVVAAAASARIGDRAQLQRVVAQAGRDLGARVIVVGPRGALLADSAGSGLRSQSYANRPEIASALAGSSRQGTRHSDTVGEELLFTAVPILDQGRTVGAVRVTQSNGAVSERVRRNVLVVVGVGLAALALGLGLAWVLAGSLARPLRGLAHTARRVEDGELDARADVIGAREQQEVAIAFNEMTDRLCQVLEAQREFVGNASHQLRTPLTGLRLRLEAAGLKSDDPRCSGSELAEAEVERLTGCSTPCSHSPGTATGRRCGRRLAPERLRVGVRALAPAGRVERASAGTGRRRRRVRPRSGRGRCDHARQPDRECARLRAGRDDGDGDLGPQRPSRGAG